MLKTKSTAIVYRKGLRRFISFYRSIYGEDKSFTDFLDRLEENASLPRKERKRLTESILVDYINFCKDEGLSANSIRTYIAGVQNFLKYKGFPLSTRWLGNLPRAVPKKSNRKHQWKQIEIREFVERAKTYRDKAIILVLFQSGIGISDLCNLDYRDICDELEEGKLPLLLDLSRFKTGVDFKTFLGADAVHYLQLYLETRTELTRDSPLFTLWNSNTSRISDGAIQKKFKEIAKELSFLRDNGEGMNPARPHSLRSAFRSRLTGKMDGDLIEFFMGHEIGESKRAYINLPDDELRELYAQFEHELSIEKTSKEVQAEQGGKTLEIDELTNQKIQDMDVTIRTLSQTLNTQGRLLDEQIREKSTLSKNIEKLSYEMEMLVSFIDSARDDPELLEPYTDEQRAWLYNKRQSPTQKPMIINRQGTIEELL